MKMTLRNLYCVFVVFCVLTAWSCGGNRRADTGDAANQPATDTASTETVAADDAPTTYATYHNERYGYSVDYPNSLIPQGESDSGDGQKFISNDGQTTLTVYSVYNVLAATTDALCADQAAGFKDNGYKITNTLANDNSYTITGSNNATALHCFSSIINDEEIVITYEYPTNAQNTFAQIINHTQNSIKR